MIEPSYPGSLDNGTVDTEYTPRPEWRDLRTTDDLIHSLEDEVKQLRRDAVYLAREVATLRYYLGIGDASNVPHRHPTQAGHIAVLLERVSRLESASLQEADR